MRHSQSPSPVKVFALASVTVAILAFGAQAAVIWSDDFSGSDRGSTAPNPYNFAGGAATDDYSVTSVAGVAFTVSGGISGVLNTADTSTTGATPNIAVFANQFAPATYPTGAEVTVTFDLRVNSLTAATAASAPRLSIIDNNVEIFTVGFSHANFSGAVAGADALGFYFGSNAGAAIDPAKGIGASTFDFGVYSSTTAASNDTNAGGGLNFFRVSFTLTQGSTAVTGSITDLGTNTTVLFPGTAAMTSALNWSNTAQEGIRFTTGLSGTSNYDVDNVSISVVPEPSAALLGVFGLVGLMGCRRCRRALRC